jgi:hypothetical protein
MHYFWFSLESHPKITINFSLQARLNSLLNIADFDFYDLVSLSYFTGGK